LPAESPIESLAESPIESPAEHPAVVPLHVERTVDPAELRWVCEHPLLAGSPAGPRAPSPGSCLGALVADGTVLGVRADGSTLLVRFADAPMTRATVQRVHEAVATDLARSEPWLGAGEGTDGGGLTVDELQAVVDAAASAVLAAHGGRLEVLARRGSTVLLRAHDACHGCRGSADTLALLVAPALRRADPAIEHVVLAP
jgi:Fe-S cluster biogenesis protein NfuA